MAESDLENFDIFRQAPQVPEPEPAPKPQAAPEPAPEPEGLEIFDIFRQPTKAEETKWSLQDVITRGRAEQNLEDIKKKTEGLTTYEKLVQNLGVGGEFIAGALESGKTLVDILWLASSAISDATDKTGLPGALLNRIPLFSPKGVSWVYQKLHEGLETIGAPTEEAKARLDENRSGIRSFFHHAAREAGGMVPFMLLSALWPFVSVAARGEKFLTAVTANPKVAISAAASYAATSLGLGATDVAYYKWYHNGLRKHLLEGGTSKEALVWADIGAAVATNIGGLAAGSLARWLAPYRKETKTAFRVGEGLSKVGVTSENLAEDLSKLPQPSLTTEILKPGVQPRTTLEALAALHPKGKGKLLEIVEKRRANLDAAINSLKSQLNISEDEVQAIKTAITKAIEPEAIAAEQAIQNNIDFAIAKLGQHFGKKLMAGTTPQEANEIGAKLTRIIDDAEAIAKQNNAKLWEVINRDVQTIQIPDDLARILGKKEATVFDLHRRISELKAVGRNATSGFERVDAYQAAEKLEDFLLNLDEHLTPEKSERIREAYDRARNYYRAYIQNFVDNPLVEEIQRASQRRLSPIAVTNLVGESTQGKTPLQLRKLTDDVDAFIGKSKELLQDFKRGIPESLKSDYPMLEATRQAVNTLAWNAFKTPIENGGQMWDGIQAMFRFTNEGAVELRNLGVLNEIRNEGRFLASLLAEDKELAEAFARRAALESDLLRRLTESPSSNILASIYGSSTLGEDLKTVKSAAQKAGVSKHLSKQVARFLIETTEDENGIVNYESLAKLLSDPRKNQMAKELLSEQEYQSLKELTKLAERFTQLPKMEDIIFPHNVEIDPTVGEQVKSFVVKLVSLASANKALPSNLVIQQRLGKAIDAVSLYSIRAPQTEVVAKFITDPDYAKFMMSLAESRIEPNEVIKNAARFFTASETGQQIYQAISERRKEQLDARVRGFTLGGQLSLEPLLGRKTP